MADAFSIKFDESGLYAGLDAIAAAAKALVRPVAQAGVQVLYDEVRLQVPVSKKGHWFHGSSFKTTGQKYWLEAGALKSAIYQAYSKDNSDETHATYHVAWNHAKAPHGFMVEFGTSRAPAKPFLRPSFDAAGARAVEVARARYVDGMRPVIASVS